MDVQITMRGEFYTFDAKVDGFDENFWKKISGTIADPSTTSNKLRLTSAEINTIPSFQQSSVEFLATVPVAPVAAQSKTFGYKNAGAGNQGRAEFDITGTAFTAKVYDEAGTIIESKTINWDSGWTANESRFRVTTAGRSVTFVINDTIVAQFNDVDISPVPKQIHIKNGNADNLDIAVVSIY